MRIGMFIGLTAYICTSAVSAQQSLPITRAIYTERPSSNGSGVEIVPATNLRRGDKVLLVVEWQSTGRSGDFFVSSKVPRQLTFQQASMDAHSVSVDGGRNWGKIGDLQISNGRELRMASVEDVTDLRWRVPLSRLSGGKGRITYSAIVR